tara:strand:- start:414 stop:1247 length:834 start_codon:yes stop_codon:yes gene_type:complete
MATRTADGADVRQTKAVTSGTSYTMSIFAKAETDNQIQLDYSDSRMGSSNVEFNTRTGQKVSGSANYSITELANGWRRYSFTSTCISSGNTGVIIRIENDEPVQLWGFQFEEGSVATSYIPHVSGSAVTRAADDLSITGSAFSDAWNPTEGTVYVEVIPRALSSSHYVFSISDGSTNESIRSFAHQTSHLLVKDGGGTQAGLDAGTFTVDTLSRIAASWEADNMKASLDGGAEATQGPTATLPTVDRLHIGSSVVGIRQLNGHIKRLIYWPYHSDSL